MFTKKGYRIDREDIPKNQLDIHIKNLTVKPFVLPDYDYNNEPFKVYRQNKKFVYMPKYYAIKNNLPQSDENTERVGEDIDLTFTGKLRLPQQQIVDKVLDHIEVNDSGILCVGTGCGKTVMALYMITKISKKTLIVVHKEFLMNQWKERIEQFLPNARVGIIRQKTVDIENKDIVIGMLQSMSRKDAYPNDIFDSFHFCCIDECVHVCSQTFSKFFFRGTTKKSLGLSATPYRKDGLTKVLTWFLGDILDYKKTKSDLEMSVKFIKAQYQTPPPVPQLNVRGKINLPNLITQISLDPIRNQQIIDTVKEYNTTGRKILILSERRQQCENLKLLLEDIQIDSGLYIGGMKEEALSKSNTKPVILATYSMASEGYDCSTLDTLIMATGRSDIEQSVGRIMRKKNHNSPLVIDFVDNVEGLRGQCTKRKRYFKKHKYIVVGEEKEKPKKKEKKKEKIYEFSDSE